MADERPQYQHGLGTIGGQQFHWGSGSPGQYWSIPYGDYPVTPNAPTGEWAHQAGAIPISNNVIPDPLLGRNRIGIMIHSGSAANLDQLYTEGCFKVDPQHWPQVRSEILKEAQSGPLYLHVQPGGVASFTNTKTMQQASIPTVGSNAPAYAPSQPSAAASSPAAAAINRSAPAPGQSSSFFDSLANVESNNRNIFSGVDKDYPGQPGSRSQGYYQIDTPTWQQFAAKAGIDVNKFPSAMNAPQDVQQQVAAMIPFSRFGSRTKNMLQQQYGQFDTGKTVGELAQQFGRGTNPPGTTLTSVPADAGPGIGSGIPTPAQPNAAAVAAETPPSNLNPFQKLFTRPPPTKDAQGNDVQGKSPIEKLAGDLGGVAKGGQQQQAAAPQPAQFAPVQDPMAQMAGPAAQLYSTVQAQAAKPLSWSSRPYGWDAGLQMTAPGMSLNTTGYG